MSEQIPQQQTEPRPYTPSTQRALQALASHQFDGTLRQLVAQVFQQEQAGALAAAALQEAHALDDAKERTIAALEQRIADLQAEVAALKGEAATDAVAAAVAAAAADGRAIARQLGGAEIGRVRTNGKA